TFPAEIYSRLAHPARRITTDDRARIVGARVPDTRRDESSGGRGGCNLSGQVELYSRDRRREDHMILMAKVGALAALIIPTMVACSTAPTTQEGKDDLVRKAAAALTAWNQEIPGIERFTRGSYGYAMFPEIGKGGAGLGWAYGRGVVYAGSQH